MIIVDGDIRPFLIQLNRAMSTHKVWFDCWQYNLMLEKAHVLLTLSGGHQVTLSARAKVLGQGNGLEIAVPFCPAEVVFFSLMSNDLVSMMLSKNCGEDRFLLDVGSHFEGSMLWFLNAHGIVHTFGAITPIDIKFGEN